MAAAQLAEAAAQQGDTAGQDALKAWNGIKAPAQPQAQDDPPPPPPAPANPVPGGGGNGGGGGEGGGGGGIGGEGEGEGEGQPDADAGTPSGSSESKVSRWQKFKDSVGTMKDDAVGKAFEVMRPSFMTPELKEALDRAKASLNVDEVTHSLD